MGVKSFDSSAPLTGAWPVPVISSARRNGAVQDEDIARGPRSIPCGAFPFTNPVVVDPDGNGDRTRDCPDSLTEHGT